MSHLFRVKGSPFWYAQVYDANGRQYKVSTKCRAECRTKMETKASREIAEQFLEQLRLQKTSGTLKQTFSERDYRYEDMRGLLLADYRRSHNRSLLKTADGTETISGLKHLDAFFKGYRASGITIEELNNFVEKRLEDGANERTVNRNLALLRRMMNLAKQHDKITRVPHFPMFSELGNEREGFVSLWQFEQIRAYLPSHLHRIATFMNDTGIRLGEAKKIKWERVDLGRGKHGAIVLPRQHTKNKRPRIVPLSPEVSAWLRNMPRKDPVFDATNLRKEWKKAATAAGLGNILVHDLRRSGVRNLRLAGNSEKIVMEISGHRTRAVFDRYNIVDDVDQLTAMDKLVEFQQVQRQQLAESKEQKALPAVASD